MKIKQSDWSSDFKEVLAYCERKRLFVGEGNPNSKILLIGKEINGGTPPAKEDGPLTIIRVISERDVERNLGTWKSPDGYDLGKLQADISAPGKRNSTWTNYQKLVGKVIGNDLGRSHYSFLDHCFMTEMNDIHLPYSNYGGKEYRKEIDAMRASSVRARAELFKMPFFRNFPVVVMACGHYPKKFGVDIEKIFGVEWKKETKVLSTGNFYNEHYGPGKILIHTRQMSMGVTNRLLSEIASLCEPFCRVGENSSPK
ncbi:hypothetical protein [uncultured Alistipes sp.]|uniref:hypothetical protein n=1 Tax=uncultured Alistipes sp. TaxID=538949 RepID=UPI00263948EA|nr:hypothetical protein [uncultured Alistipes sp.]